MVTIETLEEGDVVYANTIFLNDGSIEGLAADAVLAPEGARGVIVRKGYLEPDPDRTVFLVRSEDADKNLGIPIGCWAEELRPEDGS